MGKLKSLIYKGKNVVIQKYIIDRDKSILEAMQYLNRESVKVLFIEDKGKLQAVITDGDIRRWIIEGGDIHVPVKLCANYNPKYLINVSNEQALTFMEENSIEAVPIVDENMHIVRIVHWNKKEEKASRTPIGLPVVMMAGGMGTRLYPYTKILPKPLVPIGDIPIAEHIINQFCEYGCKDFYLIVNHKKNMIKAYFNETSRKYNVFYIDEEEALGTAGGLSLLKGVIHSTFILTNCDILVKADFSKIYEFHKKQGNLITMVCALQNLRLPYGVVNLSHNGQIESVEEKPLRSFLTNTGCYIVEPRVVEEMEKNRKIDFPDVIENYRMAGEHVGGFSIEEEAWMDMGQLEGLEKMKMKLE